MIFVERLLFGTHALMLGPRLGDHHHYSVWQGPAGKHEQFESIVEHGRIAAVSSDDRQNLFYVISEKVGLEHGLACMHPVDIAAQGIDFAVVSKITVGMCAIPAWKSICTEARMNQGQRSLHGGMRKVRKIGMKLGCEQHAFIHNSLIRETGNVEEIAAFHLAGVANGSFSTFADDVELPLEDHVVRELGVSPNKALTHERLGVPGGGTE